MVTNVLNLSTAGVPSGLLFAREPDTDLDLGELDAPGGERSGPPGTAQKPPRSNTIVLLILLIIVAAGAYLAMDPEFVMNLVEQGSVPVSVPGPAQPAPRSVTPPRMQPTEPGLGSRQPSLSAMVPTPLFGEGQNASVHADPSAPAGPISLAVDSAGTQPAQTVRPDEGVTILDAEWRGNSWVYLVRTQDGATGWISERQLSGAL